MKLGKNRPVWDLDKLFKESGAKDLEKNTRAFCSSLLSRFDLVSRKEFDAQTRALEQALAKLSALERKFATKPQKKAMASKPQKKAPAGKKPAAAAKVKQGRKKRTSSTST